MNNSILNILRNALSCNQSFISFLRQSKSISLRRGVYYGFEWLLHTAIASYLIENESRLSISNLSIGSVFRNNQRPDISFSLRQNDIFIELKTIEGNQFSWCRNDINKLQKFFGYKYIAVCSYRKNRDATPVLVVGTFGDVHWIIGLQ